MIPNQTIVPSDLIDDLLASFPKTAARVHPPPPSSKVGSSASKLKVGEWLSCRNVPYRVKAEPDSQGRTVFVLSECPFDPSHADPDSCIMQAANGQMSAHCFHNSCQGKGWQEFKERIGAPEAHHYDPPLERKRHQPQRSRATTASPSSPPDRMSPVPTSSTNRLPTIQGNKQQLRDITQQAYEAIQANNQPPSIFQRGGVLTRIRTIREQVDRPQLEPLTDDALRGVLTRVADWIQVRDTKEGEIPEAAPPPMTVVNDLASLPDWPGIPLLKGIVEVPIFDAEGGLIRESGFSPRSGLWYRPDPKLMIPEVSANPSVAEVSRAKQLLLADLLGDFPFQDEASKAHALAALILPFVRELIPGPTPLHLIDAPTEGTGKTLLASVIAQVSTGREAEPIPEAENDAEWRKRLTSALAEGPTFLMLDNLNRTLDSGALAMALTSLFWKDRLLGVSKMVTLPVTCVWMATGNNTRLSRELIRRTLFCRLDAQVADPCDRSGFRHPNLPRWLREHRGELVWATLTLVQTWIVAGQPRGKQTLGKFEDWAEVIGGLFDCVEIPGLMANAQSFRRDRADNRSEWEAFCKAWWGRHADQPVGTKELFELVQKESLLDSVIGDKGERSQRTRLGQALSKYVDRVFGPYRLTQIATDHSDRQQYALVKVESVSATPPEEVCEWEA